LGINLDSQERSQIWEKKVGAMETEIKVFGGAGISQGETLGKNGKSRGGDHEEVATLCPQAIQVEVAGLDPKKEESWSVFRACSFNRKEPPREEAVILKDSKIPIGSHAVFGVQVVANAAGSDWFARLTQSFSRSFDPPAPIDLIGGFGGIPGFDFHKEIARGGNGKGARKSQLGKTKWNCFLAPVSIPSGRVLDHKRAIKKSGRGFPMVGIEVNPGRTRRG
jgi:hypothetical protein